MLGARRGPPPRHRITRGAPPGRDVSCGAVVLSLTKLTPKGRHYYKRELGGPEADGAGPRYWLEHPELAGRWLGRGAEALDIDGVAVSEMQFDRLFGAGRHPLTGQAFGRGWEPESERAVAGFALTFSPPKSVSVLWAIAGQDVAQEIGAAQDEAVRAAIAYLEDHAAFTRRGKAGVIQVDTDGLTAAAFVHRTSRAGDPQLHTHVLVANKVRAKDDGRWLSLDGSELYRSQKAAGLLYKAALRAELSRRLGLEWSAVDANGIAEVVGVPEELCSAWSARRAEVLDLAALLVAEREAALGRSLSAGERAEVHQLAAYRSRAPKAGVEEPTDVLRARWRGEAVSFGYAPESWLSSVFGRRRRLERVSVDASKLVDQALATLEERQATWTRADVVEVVSTLLPPTTYGDAERTRRRIESLVDSVLADGRALSVAAPLAPELAASPRRADGMATVQHHGSVRFTTRANLAREALVLQTAAEGIDAGLGVVGKDVARRAIEAAGLGRDQAAAVEALLTGGERIICVVGPAGVGKSHLLSAARAGWEAAHHEVRGLAPSARAAAVMDEEAGIKSDTLAKALAEIKRGRSLGPRCVVVVDEASMATTADLAALVGHVRAAGAKLVLVGDDHQLGAVGAGGLFATLVADREPLELSTVRRFSAAWERAASLRLRAGDRAILPVYARHGRVLGGSREAMIDAAFSAWATARATGRSVVVMAADHETVDALALRARAALVSAGQVTGPSLPAGRHVIGVGDEVMAAHNDRRLRTGAGEWVRNGSRWVVRDIGTDGSALLSSMEGHGSVRVPETYVTEHLALAYATTIHKAQGLTVDEGIVVADSSMPSEALYVGMTRGRCLNRVMAVTETQPEHGRARRRSALETLGQVLTRPGAEASAHRVLRAGLARLPDEPAIRQEPLQGPVAHPPPGTGERVRQVRPHRRELSL
jgi:conjugative relaxase-like TrwC/TraI family protein